MHQHSKENLTLYYPCLVTTNTVFYCSAVKKNLKNDFIYLFDKFFFNLVEFPHLTHNGTTQIQEQGK